MKKLRNLKGIIPALSTIVKKDGSIDEEGMRSQVRFNIEKRVHGLAPAIIGGEFYKLADDERKRVYEIVIDEANGKVPVLAGASHTGTEPAIELCKFAKDAGADGVIVMPPYFGKAESSLYLYEHYSRIATSVDLPLMIQDAEDYTGVVISPVLCSRLIKEHSNVFMMKVEGARSLEKIREIKEMVSNKVVLFGGMWAKILLEELKVGGAGNIPGACLPELLVDVFNRYEGGDRAGATRIFEKYRKWIDYLDLHPLLSANLVKETLRLRGIVRSSSVRGPKQELTNEHTRALRQILVEIGVLRRVDRISR